MTRTAYHQSRYHRLRAAGLCTSCGRNQSRGRGRCSRCHHGMLERRRLSRSEPRPVREVQLDGDQLTPIDVIARYTGYTIGEVRHSLAMALRKVKRECRRRGISAADIVGKPVSMLADAEES